VGTAGIADTIVLHVYDPLRPSVSVPKFLVPGGAVERKKKFTSALAFALLYSAANIQNRNIKKEVKFIY
jgi:hypothetical protein